MEIKMKTFFRILMIGLLALLLIGCDLFQTPEKPDNTVSVFPTFLGSYSSNSRSVVLQIDEEMPLAQLYYPLFGGPHLIGFETGSYNLDTTYSVSILDADVNVTISRNAEDNATVYTGAYEDGEGNFVLTLDDDGDFNYNQRIVYEVYQDPTGLEPEEENVPGFIFFYNTVSGGLVDTSFSGNGQSIMYVLELTSNEDTPDVEFFVGSLSGSAIEVCGRSDRFGLKISGDLAIQTIADEYPEVDYSTELVELVEEYAEAATIEDNDFVILYYMNDNWGEEYATSYDEVAEEELQNPNFDTVWNQLLNGDS
jgi:hypothetical protein